MCCSGIRALEIRFVVFPLPQFPLIPMWMGAAFADLTPSSLEEDEEIELSTQVVTSLQ